SSNRCRDATADLGVPMKTMRINASVTNQTLMSASHSHPVSTGWAKEHRCTREPFQRFSLPWLRKPLKRLEESRPTTATRLKPGENERSIYISRRAVHGSHSCDSNLEKPKSRCQPQLVFASLQLWLTKPWLA